MINCWRSRYAAGVRGSEINWRRGEKATLKGTVYYIEEAIVISLMDELKNDGD